MKKGGEEEWEGEKVPTQSLTTKLHKKILLVDSFPPFRHRHVQYAHNHHDSKDRKSEAQAKKKKREKWRSEKSICANTRLIND